MALKTEVLVRVLDYIFSLHRTCPQLKLLNMTQVVSLQNVMVASCFTFPEDETQFFVFVYCLICSVIDSSA
jgi:hypothetical protein